MIAAEFFVWDVVVEGGVGSSAQRRHDLVNWSIGSRW